MPLSKQARHCKRLAESKKLAKNAESQETAPTKKYEKKTFQEIPAEIIEEKTRSGTKKPSVRSDFINQDFAMLFDSKCVRKLLLLLLCPGCKNLNCLNFLATSTQGLCTFFQVFCVLCPFETSSLRSSAEELSLKSALAVKGLGIQKTQAQRFFQLIGTGFTSPSASNPGSQKTRSVNFFSTFFDKMFDKISTAIVEKITPKVESEAFNELVSLVKSGQIEKPQTGLDGAYSHPGRNSPTCGSSLVATFPTSYKIIGHEITKRAQEAKQDCMFKGDVRWDIQAQHLEGENCKKLLEKELKKLAELFSYDLSIDKDCQIKKLLKTTIKSWPNEVKILYDAAHTIKNVPNHLKAIIQSNDYWGDSLGRIGFNNYFRLLTCASATTKILCKQRREKGISREQIEQKLRVLKLHVAGFHVKCENRSNCQKEPIIKSYPNKYSKKQVHKLLTAIFDKYLCSEDFVDAIYNCGVTSPNEYFHSILTNRRLIVKGEQVSVKSYNYDSSYCLGILFFNLGELGCFERLFSHFDLTLNPQSRQNFESNEKISALRRQKNLQVTPIIRHNRKKNQKQFKTTAKERQNYTYLSVKETYELEKQKNITAQKKPQKLLDPSHPNITKRKRKRT